MINSLRLKRAIAFVIDIFIVSLIVSLIITNKNANINEQRSRELMKVINDYSNETITMDEYLKKYSDILYEVNEDNYNDNIVYLIVNIAYFLIFQFLNRGATIGKKIMKIRIVNRDKKDISLWQLLIRVSLVNELLAMILLLIIVKLFSGVPFLLLYGLVSLIRNAIVIVCGVMIFVRKDDMGLHDIISCSQVIIDD